MRTILVIWILAGISPLYSQSKKFKALADTIVVANNQLIADNDWRTFLSSSQVNEELDLLDIDQERLNATLFFMVNKYRKKRRRKEFVYSEPLNKSAVAYSTYYRSGSFERSEGNKKKSAKAAAYSAKQNGFTGAFVEVIISKPEMLDREKLKNFYHDKKATKESGDDLGLYYGSAPSKGDSTEQVPIENYTYYSFCEQIVKQWFIGRNRKLTTNKALKYASCNVVLDERSLYKTKIPYAKVIVVFGGYRTQLLPQEETGVADLK